jgi:hypothetical protein
LCLTDTVLFNIIGTDEWMSMEHFWNDSCWKEPKYPKKHLSQCHITRSPSWTSLTLNPGLCIERPVTGCLPTARPKLFYHLITGWTKECKKHSIRICTHRAEIRTLGPPEYEVRMHCAICGSAVFTAKHVKMFVRQARSALCYTTCWEEMATRRNRNVGSNRGRKNKTYPTKNFTTVRDRNSSLIFFY